MAIFSNSSRRIDIDIVANDKASVPFRNVADNMTSMSGKINSGIVNLNAGLQRYNNAMNTLYRSTQIAIGLSGALIYKFTKDSVEQFAEFERQHAKTMGAIANNYDKTAEAQKRFLDDQKKLKEQSLQLGTFGPDRNGSLYSPTQVSYAQTALAKAGLKPDQVSTVMPQVLKFAGGNDLQIDTAADYAVNVATMFDVPTAKWGQMLDQITRAADISTVDVTDLFESLKYAGGIASATKRPLEEILGVLSVMGNAGLKGSMAGTGTQAFLTRLLAPALPTKNVMDAAPSEKVKNIYTAFVSETTDKNGKFKGMANVSGMLDETMSQLNDREQAWLAQRLFGLFQMKAGFTLARAGESGIDATVRDITDNSAGTNDNKWKIMLESSYGKQTALANAFAGIQTDVGYRLAPLTNEIADQLFNVLSNKGNYNIDFSKLKAKLEEASQLISDQYGNQMGDFVRSIGSIGMNGSRIAVATSPLIPGIGSSFAKMLSGDLPGAFNAMKSAVSETNKKIEDLPPELQGMAREVRNVIIALTALAGINFGARLLENLTTIWSATVGKLMKTTNMNVSATTVILRDTGLVNEQGQPIYKQEEVTTKGGGKGGPPVTTGGTTGTKEIIVDKNGKPVKGNVSSEAVILDANGNPIKKTSKPDTVGVVPKGPSALSKGVGIASWVYALGEMFGLNDAILDKVGAKQGTQARENIDKGRTVLNWGMMASFADDVLLKGVLKKGLANAAGWGVKTAGAAMDSSVAVTGAPALPLVGAVSVLYDKIRENQKYEDFQKNVNEGRKAYVSENGVVYGDTPAEKAAKQEKYKYQFGGVNGYTELDKYDPAPNKFLHPFQYSDWKKRQQKENEEREKRIAAEKARFDSAQKITSAQSGQMLSWDDYNKNLNSWKQNTFINQTTGQLNAEWQKWIKGQFDKMTAPMDITDKSKATDPEVLKQSNSLLSIMNKVIGGTGNQNKSTGMLGNNLMAANNNSTQPSTVNMDIPKGSDVNSKLDSIHSDITQLNTQKPPTVIVNPPNVNVDVKVDKDGNVSKSSYITNVGGLDKLFQQLLRRDG